VGRIERRGVFDLSVVAGRVGTMVTSRRGDAVLMSRDDYDALQETAHLLRSPMNARRLLESLEQALAGLREEHGLI